MITILLIGLIFFSFILIKSTDIVLVGIRRLSKLSGKTAFRLSAVILTLGTSFPELSVSTISAFSSSSRLSLGVVLGSNIANLSLVAGVGAFIAGKVFVRGEFLKRDVLIALLVGGMPVFLLLDGMLSRLDGMVLLLIYLSYASDFFKKNIALGKAHGRAARESAVAKFLRTLSSELNGNRTKEYAKLFFGIALLLMSADFIVRISKILAEAANIPLFLVGLIILAIGTSLPELAFAIRSLRQHEPNMFFGNMLGSIITNSTLVIGTSALIRPIEVSIKNDYMLAAATFVIMFLAFWYFIRTKHRLDRLEAAALIILYLIFAFLEFI